MNKHTQGPWRYWACRIDSRTGMEDYLQFANLQGHVFRASISHITEADARLIAAAPELLAALIGVVRVADRATVEFDAARAAIAKATRGM